MKKKLIGILFTFILACIITSCGSNPQKSDNKTMSDTVDTLDKEIQYEIYKIKDVGYISIPNNMELQTGTAKKIAEDEIKQLSYKYHYLVADDRVAFRQKGISDDISKNNSLYAGITIQTFFGKCMKQTDDYSFTPEKLSEIDALFKQQVDALSNKAGFLVIWAGTSIVKINNSYAIKNLYIRKMDNEPNISVNMYQFQNNDRLHQIILSYKQEDSTIWKPLFSEVINSFNLTNIK